MSYTLQQTINYSQAFIGNLNPTVFTGEEPALTTANTIVSLLTNPPLTWPWNRAYFDTTLEQGIQDYLVLTNDFGFLEKVVLSYTDASGIEQQVELEAVFNNKALGTTTQQSRPNTCAVQLGGGNTSGNTPSGFTGGGFSTLIGDGVSTTYTVTHNLNTENIIVQVFNAITGELDAVDMDIASANSISLTFGTAPITNSENVVILAVSSSGSGSPPGPDGVVFRFMNSPDQTYYATFIYQLAPLFFTDVSQDWFTQCGIPYSFLDVFNSLFLSEMFQFSDDPRAVQYRQRGMAALLSKASGLSETEKNEILGFSMANDLQTIAAHLRVQQASQARGI
jgi:hypothetical protein